MTVCKPKPPENGDFFAGLTHDIKGLRHFPAQVCGFVKPTIDFSARWRDISAASALSAQTGKAGGFNTLKKASGILSAFLKSQAPRRCFAARGAFSAFFRVKTTIAGASLAPPLSPSFD